MAQGVQDPPGLFVSTSRNNVGGDWSVSKHDQSVSDAENKERQVKGIIARHAGRRKDLLQVLHAIQDLSEQNYLNEQELLWIAEGLDVPASEVYGVATFYSMYSVKPRGRHLIRVCENAPCHVVGADKIMVALKQQLGVDVGETTADGRFTLESTSCLGVCAVAPAIMIGQDVHGNLQADQLASILAQYV